MWRQARMRDQIAPRPGIDQCTRRIGVTVPDRVVQGAHAIVVTLRVDLGRVTIGTWSCQDAHHLGVPEVRRFMHNRGLHRPTDHSRVGACIEQPAHDLRVAHASGHAERRAILVRTAHRGRALVNRMPQGDQALHGCEVALCQRRLKTDTDFVLPAI